jgi:hypothetical protein
VTSAASGSGRSGWLLAAVAALAGLGTALARTTPIYDPDYFWHLETGAWIAEHRSIPRVDPFSHSFAGKPWLFVDWAADLLMAGLYAAFGHGGNILFFSLIAGLAVAAWLWRLGRSDAAAGPWSVAAVGALLAAATVFRVAPRPQTLTLILMVAVMHVALPWRGHSPGRSAQRAWLALPLLVLWQNLHSSALLGWLVLVAAAVGEQLGRHEGEATPAASSKIRWVQLVLGGFALLLAPAPLDRLAAGFAHLGDDRVPAILMEWAPVWRDGWAPARSGWGVALGLLSALALVAAAQPLVRKRLPLSYWLVGAGFLLLGLRTARFVPMAALALAPLALGGLTGLQERAHSLARQRMVTRLCAVLLAAGAAGVWHHARPLGLGIQPGDFPEGAANYLRRTPLKGPMYNDFFDGGYLLWALQRRHPVLIDGRAMALYGVAFVARVFDQQPGDLDKLLGAYSCGFAVVYNDQRLREVQARPGWQLTWLDDRAFVAVDSARNPQAAARDGYRVVHPADLAVDLPRWQTDSALAQQALGEAQRMVQTAPYAAMPRVVQATALLALGKPQEALQSVQQALARKADSLPALRTGAMACDALGLRDCVCGYTAAVLKRVPKQLISRQLSQKHRCEAPKPQ